MNVSTQLLDYNANVTINCSIQPTGVVTMAMKVLHNTCNMCICDLPDMNAFKLWGYISGKSLMPMLQPLHILIQLIHFKVALATCKKTNKQHVKIILKLFLNVIILMLLYYEIHQRWSCKPQES